MQTKMKKWQVVRLKLKIMGIVVFSVVTLGFILGFIHYSNTLQENLSREIVQGGGLGVGMESPEAPETPEDSPSPEEPLSPETPGDAGEPEDPEAPETPEELLVAVPNLYLMPVEEAEAVLQGLGFLVEVHLEANHQVEADRVFWQNPRREFLYEIGKTVYLTVSTGPEDAAVPNVLGLSEGVAKARIEGAGLVFSVGARSYHDTSPRGNVLTQSYLPGTKVEAGTSIRVTISLGKDPALSKVTVPELLGLSEAEALARLESLGLKGAVGTRASHDTRPKGTVFAQSVAPGQAVDPGTTVHLSISEGKAVETVAVPDLRGLTEAEAIERLGGLGLAHVVERANDDTQAEGKVFQQSPQPGTAVEKGTTIRIHVSLGAAPEG